MSWTLLDRPMGSMVGESLREVLNARKPEIGWNGEREWWSSEGPFVSCLVSEVLVAD